VKEGFFRTFALDEIDKKDEKESEKKQMGQRQARQGVCAVYKNLLKARKSKECVHVCV